MSEEMKVAEWLGLRGCSDRQMVVVVEFLEQIYGKGREGLEQQALGQGWGLSTWYSYS